MDWKSIIPGNNKERTTNRYPAAQKPAGPSLSERYRQFAEGPIGKTVTRTWNFSRKHIDPLALGLLTPQLDLGPDAGITKTTINTALLTTAAFLGEKAAEKSRSKGIGKLEALITELYGEGVAVALAKIAADFAIHHNPLNMPALFALLGHGADEAISIVARELVKRNTNESTAVTDRILTTSSTLEQLSTHAVLAWSIYAAIDSSTTRKDFGMATLLLTTAAKNWEMCNKNLPDADIVFSALLRNAIRERTATALSNAAHMDAERPLGKPTRNGKHRIAFDPRLEARFWDTLRDEIFLDAAIFMDFDAMRQALLSNTDSRLPLPPRLARLKLTPEIWQQFLSKKRDEVGKIWNSERTKAVAITWSGHAARGEVWPLARQEKHQVLNLFLTNSAWTAPKPAEPATVTPSAPKLQTDGDNSITAKRPVTTVKPSTMGAAIPAHYKTGEDDEDQTDRTRRRERPTRNTTIDRKKIAVAQELVEILMINPRSDDASELTDLIVTKWDKAETTGELIFQELIETDKELAEYLAVRFAQANDPRQVEAFLLGGEYFDNESSPEFQEAEQAFAQARKEYEDGNTDSTEFVSTLYAIRDGELETDEAEEEEVLLARKPQKRS